MAQRLSLRSVAVDTECFDQLTRVVEGTRSWVLLTLYEFVPTAWPPLIRALNEAAVRGARVLVVVNRWRLKRAARRCTGDLRNALVPEVHLRLWNHTLANNTHSKYALRDDGTLVVVTSNVSAQFTTCGWRGLGVELGGRPGPVARDAWGAFRWLWTRSKPVECRGRPDARRAERAPHPSRPAKPHAVTAAVRWQTPCAACLKTRKDAPPVHALLALIREASTTIDLVTPNLSSRTVLAALQEAVGRGVRVRAVLARSMNSVYKRLGHLTNEQTADRYPEIEIRWTGEGGSDCRVGDCMAGSHDRGVNHSKLLVADGTRVLVGSSNLDFFSTKNSSELNVEMEDPSGTMSAAFQRFWRDAR